MTPTSFEFTVTMPGDPRLVGAVRQLTKQAAGYAQLTADAGADLAGHVARATEAAIAAGGRPDLPIRVVFSGDEETVNVVISCEAAAAAHPPHSSAADGVSVDWTMDGSRRICRIRQRIPA